MKNFLGFYQAPEWMAWIWTKRPALAAFGESWWSIMCGN